MKTTIELPDELARRARAVARERHVTLRELITEGLRAELERLTSPPTTAAFRFRTVGGSGLRPGVSPSSLTSLAYELPA